MSNRKNCGACGAQVAVSSKAGQRCPHCGAFWSYEKTVWEKLRDDPMIVVRLLGKLVPWLLIAALFICGFGGLYYWAKRDLQPPSPELREKTIKRMMERVH